MCEPVPHSTPTCPSPCEPQSSAPNPSRAATLSTLPHGASSRGPRSRSYAACTLLHSDTRDLILSCAADSKRGGAIRGSARASSPGGRSWCGPSFLRRALRACCSPQGDARRDPFAQLSVARAAQAAGRPATASLTPALLTHGAWHERAPRTIWSTRRPGHVRDRITSRSSAPVLARAALRSVPEHQKTRALEVR